MFVFVKSGRTDDDDNEEEGEERMHVKK